MGKFIMVGGKKVYLKDGEAVPEVQEDNVTPPAEEAPVAEVPAESGELSAAEEQKAAKIAETISKAVANAIRPQEVASTIAVKNQSVIEKVRSFVAGKDLSARGKLTKDEVIVGFFKGLVEKDDAVVKALSEGTAADGGYLFPDEFRAEVVMALAAASVVKPLVRVIPMSRDIMKIPSVVAKPLVTWTAENATKSTTTAEFYEITLTARKCAEIMYLSDELVADSDQIDVVRLIIDLFAQEMATQIDRVICQGNGTTEPTGLNTATIADGATGVLSIAKIIQLYGSLPQQYHKNASWLMATDNWVKLMQMTDSNGQYLWQPSLQAGAPNTLLGKPVYVSDWIGEANIYFGDFKYYWLGDRQQMTVKISQDTETAFTKDQTAVRVVMRVAGNVALADAFRQFSSIP